MLGQAGPSRQAYLIKLPEDIISALESSQGASVTVGMDGSVTLNVPDQDPMPLDARPASTASEIHRLSSGPSPTLKLAALATTRLNIPFSSASTARAADKLRAQTDALEKQRKERALKVDGIKRHTDRVASGAMSAPMAVTTSAPGAVWGSGTGTGSIPLKTRVMQYLAMGETTQEDLCRRMGGDEQNVMRVVKVVGRPSKTQPGSWSLQPNQYSKIKLGAGQWPYTYAEQQQVIRLAYAAFDELGLPANSEERMEFEKKERDASNAFANRSSDESEKNAPQLSNAANTSTLQSNAVTSVRERDKARTESPAPVTRQKVPTKRGPQSKIAKERAKFVAERQRAGSGSLPNIKGPNGIASPRLGPTASPSVSPEKKDPSKFKDGEHKEKEAAKGKERKDESRRREEKKESNRR